MFDLYLLLASDDADAHDATHPASAPPISSLSDIAEDDVPEPVRLDMIGGDGDTGAVSLAA
ncbi:MAG: hypothetical protein AAGF99_02855 [Bacteroidota bacterium]